MISDSVTITPKTYSLQDIMKSIHSVLHKTYSDRFYWVRCELSRISLHNQSGHCYLDLIDKNDIIIVAQMRGILWADKYLSVSEKFKAVTNTPLSGGMKVLLQCSINFHAVHGLSLTVADIEPSFTLGEMARMKNESIARLKSEDLFNRNRKLKLSLLPGKLALISVATSRGFLDFISTLENHHQIYSINYKLYEAVLQGESAVSTIIKALNSIYSSKEKYDAILIIRGGAGDAGLSCYDEYSLAAAIALSPLPVITGIGHASNETVVEMIAFKNCITPTAAAVYILEKFDVQFSALTELSIRLNDQVKVFINSERQFNNMLSERFCLLVKNHLNSQRFQLLHLLAGMPAHLDNFFSVTKLVIKQSIQSVLNVNKSWRYTELLITLNRDNKEIAERVENILGLQKTNLTNNVIKLAEATLQIKKNNELIMHLADKTNLLDPVNTLKRGYSITRHHGKALTEIKELSAGMQLETKLADGIVFSRVEE